MERLKELWSLERFALGGAAAIAAWLLTHRKGVPTAGWWLPLVFLLICAGRAAAAVYHLGFRTSKYLITIEKYYLPPEGGWEAWFRKQGYNETLAYLAVWGVAIVAAALLPFLIGR